MPERHTTVKNDGSNLKADLHRLSGDKDVVRIAATGEPIIRGATSHVNLVDDHRDEELQRINHLYGQFMKTSKDWESLEALGDQLEMHKAQLSDKDKQVLAHLKMQHSQQGHQFFELYDLILDVCEQLKKAGKTPEIAEKINKGEEE